MMLLLRQIRILPLLVLVAMICFAVRLGDFVTGVRGTAYAQNEVAASPPPLPAKPVIEAPKSTAEVAPSFAPKVVEEKAAAPGDLPAHPADTAVAEGTPPPMPVEGKEGEKVDWQDSSEAEFSYSEVREDLYKDLAKRREELDTREKEIGTREALLEAAGRELDQKLRELTAIKTEIEGLLKQQSDEEIARITSLVKIYEGMKAKDAARIFNTLEMDVLLEVMGRMSERKSAPILAEMDAERARSVTILLSQKNQFPTMPAE